MDIGELRKIIEDCGIVGAGGAGYPTHLKMDARANIILLNCAECEPLLQTDQHLMATYTDEIISALDAIAAVLNARVIIAVKETHKEALAAMEGKTSASMQMVVLEDAYPAGDEVLLINEACGVVVPPGTFPIDSGFIVLNVETVLNIYYALRDNQPVTHKWVTIAGEVSKPAVVRMEIGVTVEHAVDQAGGATVENPVYISGGPMMGTITAATDAVKKTTNAIIVLPQNHSLARKSSPQIALNRVASACCQCRSCTDMCPRYLLGYPIEPHKIMRSLAARSADTTAFEGVLYCCGCGICEKIACPQSLSPCSLMKQFKDAMAKEGIRPRKQQPAPISTARQYRKVSSNRLKTRLGVWE